MSTVLVWVAIVLCAIALTVVLWLRRGLRAYRASLEGIVQGVLQLRRMAAASPRLVALPEESPDVPPLERAEPRLEAAGLYPVGDYHELGEDGRPAGAVRWFVSDDGTVLGWLGLSAAGPVMLLLSEIPGRGFVTTLRAPPAPSTAVPPSVVQERLEWDEGLDAALERHAAAVARMGAALPVEGLEEALGCMDALKAHVAAWRAAQDHAGLLEADVRKILGDSYENMGETVIGLVRLAEELAAQAGRG